MPAAPFTEACACSLNVHSIIKPDLLSTPPSPPLLCISTSSRAPSPSFSLFTSFSLFSPLSLSIYSGSSITHMRADSSGSLQWSSVWIGHISVFSCCTTSFDFFGCSIKICQRTITGSFIWVIHRWICTDGLSPGRLPSFKLTVNFTSPAFPAVIPKIIISWARPSLHADLITACKLQLILLLQQQMDFMIYDAGRDFSSALLRFHSRTRRKAFDQTESAVRCLILACFSDSASKFRLFF